MMIRSKPIHFDPGFSLLCWWMTCPDLSNLVLSFYLSWIVMSWPVPICPDLSQPVLNCSHLFCLSWPVLMFPDPCWPVLNCPHLSWPFLTCFDLSLAAMICPVLKRAKCLFVCLYVSELQGSWAAYAAKNLPTQGSMQIKKCPKKWKNSKGGRGQH